MERQLQWCTLSVARAGAPGPSQWGSGVPALARVPWRGAEDVRRSRVRFCRRSYGAASLLDRPDGCLEETRLRVLAYSGRTRRNDNHPCAVISCRRRTAERLRAGFCIQPDLSVYSGSLWRVAGARRVGTGRGTMDWLSLTVTLRRSRQRCAAGAGLPFAEGRPRKTRVKIAEAVCASAVGRIGSRSWGGIKKHGCEEAENAGPCGGQRLCARTHEACRDQSRSRGRRSWFPISPVASSALCPSAFASGAVFLHRSSKI
ncbi:hypothetical protein OH76DRAFT_978689 [Lentinus brumalis]|uniref:Uncharacterized protein n=1 Tax=Lentinus brumalis TaxID=2498619 RepID=A0A371DPW0_9APHY|nr:hypothetical protein OH76DRAFT_978689 [Polyporus brumalis]